MKLEDKRILITGGGSGIGSSSPAASPTPITA
jgi:short-subunit dehydrogenase involved in D-alanine esterification of teichoic acids